MKPSTQAKIAQRVEFPPIIVNQNYIFSRYGRVERFVISVGAYVVYRKPNGFGQCPLTTFQRLYKQYGVEENQWQNLSKN
jgi:hypothetical protein